MGVYPCTYYMAYGCECALGRLKVNLEEVPKAITYSTKQCNDIIIMHGKAKQRLKYWHYGHTKELLY